MLTEIASYQSNFYALFYEAVMTNKIMCGKEVRALFTQINKQNLY